MTETTEATISIRPLQPTDLERVIDIDHQINRRPRQKFFEKRLQAALKHEDIFVALGAESGADLVGFAIARLVKGEFGEADANAALDVLGVDTEVQRHGISWKLLDVLNGQLADRGVARLRTQVDWRDRAMVTFLAGADFQVSPHQVLERATSREETAKADADADLDPPRLDAGIVDFSDPAGDDFEALSRDQVFVRSMTEADLDAVVRIDRKLTGVPRDDYYRAKLHETLTESGVRVSLVAEVDGAAAGFIMARVDFGEYGRTEPAAVMDTIGVDPDRAGTGIGDAILSQLLANLDALQVEHIRTRTAWNAFGLMHFLDAHGFRPAQQLALNRAVAA